MAPVSQFRQSLVRAIMKTTISKTSALVGLVHASGDLVVTALTATPLNR